MPADRVLRVRQSEEAGVAAADLRAGIERIREEQNLPDGFPAAVDRAAEEAAANPRLPDLDRTDLPFVTIDPASAMDLDQALHIERAGDGFIVYYAIADLMAFLKPGDPVDEESHRRGETCYGADAKIPLHPKAISEDAGSLLADQVRPALLWTIQVDALGEGTEVTVERALVKSRAKLDYETVQQQLEDGTASESLQLLREVGKLRVAREQERGAVSLPLPEQEIDCEGEQVSLSFRAMLPVENWNAQISLLTGFAAAHLMKQAKVGILRTLPAPAEHDVKRLRRTAKALGITWPTEMDYPEFIRGLDAAVPEHAAMAVACTRLLRGASYVGFEGTLPDNAVHAALSAEYAHVTAPLRRLVDRYGGEICLALTSGAPVPEWVTARLSELPDIMRDSGRRANAYENAVVNLVEALALRGRVGEQFQAVVLEAEEKDDKRGSVQVEQPAVEAAVTAQQPVPVGDEVTVTLAEADPQQRKVSFTL